MKCQILFSRKNKNIIYSSSAESAHSVVSVKRGMISGQIFLLLHENIINTQ